MHDFVAVDMGGTSFDLCLVRGGQPEIKTDWNWRYRYYIGLPMVDVQSVGAGGGSIARVRQGALLVGPESAGSMPGPVCYGRGGDAPDGHRRRRRCSATSRPTASPAGACASTSTRRAPPSNATSPSRSGSTSSRRRGASSASSTPTWRTRPARCSPSHGADPRDARDDRLRRQRRRARVGDRRASSASTASSCPKAAPAFSALGVLVADYVVDLVRAYVVPLSQVDLGRVRTLMHELARGGRQGARADRARRGATSTSASTRRCATRARTST